MAAASPREKHLFSTAPWELDDVAQRWTATLVFPGPVEGEFDYAIPERLQGEVEPGRRVKAPFGKGNRLVEGYCVRTALRPAVGRPLKELAAVVDRKSLLSATMLQLTRWIAERYLCSWGQVLEAVVPAGVRGEAGTRIAKFYAISANGQALLDSLPNGRAPIEPDEDETPPPASAATPNAADGAAGETSAHANGAKPPKPFKLTPKQARVLQFLARSPEPLTAQHLAKIAQCGWGPIQALAEKGLIVSEKRRTAPTAPAAAVHARESNLVMNPAQAAALQEVHDSLNARRHETILLHGVTGSGKTEVYIQAIQEVVRFGRQSIVLVPEISLTPQTVERFRSRFDGVAVLHSHLTDAERHFHWEKIARGAVQVVVGARSAIFAPTPNLGLIVLDEEHETTFKQETAPRYHAREVALERAKMEQIPLILGSATPSLESWSRVSGEGTRLIQLKERVRDLPLPPVGVLDMRQEYKRGGAKGAISRPLRMEMEKELTAGNQVILMLNRRGFSTHLQCPACGHVVKCKHCDIALTYHRADEVLLCHYCDHHRGAPNDCPECRIPGIRYGGIGTQKLEQEVNALFPDFPCLRMDADAMQGPGSHERALAAFRAGQVKILLGTQMIAKGLDFPNVTLVGVVNADLALHLPDFRAAERTFQLLAQVAGRAGRGEKGGRVLVQTYSPDHPAIQAAARHDFEAFTKIELPTRQAFSYPPYGSMARVVVRGPTEELTAQFADLIAEKIRAAAAGTLPDARLLGPAPAPLAKLRDKFRYHLQIHAVDGEKLRQAVKTATDDLDPPDELEWIVDIDPLSML